MQALFTDLDPQVHVPETKAKGIIEVSEVVVETRLLFEKVESGDTGNLTSLSSISSTFKIKDVAIFGEELF